MSKESKLEVPAAGCRAPSAGSEVRNALTHYIVQAAATYSRGQWDIPEDMIRSAGITAAEIKSVLPKGEARNRVMALLPNDKHSGPPTETQR